MSQPNSQPCHSSQDVSNPNPGSGAVNPDQVTGLLVRWRDGDSGALDRLMPLVYEELHHVAQRHMGSEQGSTLQATALVHEAYLRMLKMDVPWQNRAHFFAIAAGAMRRILVDRARRRRAEKRGGEARPVELSEVADLVEAPGMNPDDLLFLDKSLKSLAALDSRKARVLELRLFGGLSIDETAEALSISTATVERELRMGRAWIARRLRGGDEA